MNGAPETLTTCCLCFDTYDMSELASGACPDCRDCDNLEELLHIALSVPEDVKQQYLIKSYHYLGGDDTGKFEINLPFEEEPKKVWYVYTENPTLPFEPSHQNNAFLLSLIHDCRYDKQSCKLEILCASPGSWYLIEI